MTTDELLQEVQYTVDHQGQVTAVVLTPQIWQRLLEALELVDDQALVLALRDKLVRGPQQSAALAWQDVVSEW